MSVTRVRESHDGREGEIGTDSATLRRVFWVETNNPKDGARVARDAAGVPSLYDVYFDGLEVNQGYVVKRKTATNHGDSQMLWKVEVEYEQKNDENDDQRNPTQRPTIYAWSDFSTAVELLKDTVERACENTAKQPFDPVIETLKVTEVLTITRPESSYDADDMKQYKNTLNKRPFFGFAAGEGRMESIAAVSEYDAEFGRYWTVTYTMHFRDTSLWVPDIEDAQLIGGPIEPWDETRRNIGTRELLATNTKLRAAQDAAGKEFTDPVDLDADGKRIPESTSPYKPFYIVFKPFTKKSWTPLDLDPT